MRHHKLARSLGAEVALTDFSFIIPELIDRWMEPLAEVSPGLTVPPSLLATADEVIE